jgi:hypothetical protein
MMQLSSQVIRLMAGTVSLIPAHEAALKLRRSLHGDGGADSKEGDNKRGCGYRRQAAVV